MLIQREKQRRLTTRCTDLRVCDQVYNKENSNLHTIHTYHCDDCLIHAIPTSYDVLCGVHIGIVKVVAVT